MTLVLPEYFAIKPEWWLGRINHLLSGWDKAPEETLETAYEAAWKKIPCTGSPGFRPCANCFDLGFPCGSPERPFYRSTKSSLQWRTLEAVIVYPSGEKEIITYPLQEGDKAPHDLVCSYCRWGSGYEDVNEPCAQCGRHEFVSKEELAAD